MSFIGLIEYIMQASGLQTLFELIYAEGSVNTMLHGREISGVTRAHTLVCTVLSAKLFEYNLGKPCNDWKFYIS